jgi:hypothetical protein
VTSDAAEPVSFGPTSSPCSANATADRCSPTSTSGHTTTSANTPTPSSTASKQAPCRATVRGPRGRSTSSGGGPRAASRAELFPKSGEVTGIKPVPEVEDPVAFPRLSDAQLARLSSYGTPQMVDAGDVLYAPATQPTTSSSSRTRQSRSSSRQRGTRRRSLSCASAQVRFSVSSTC